MRRALFLSLMVLMLFPTLGSAQNNSVGKKVYVLPLRDDVEQTMVYLARRGVKEALAQKADVLLIHLDTNGGRVDCTEDIIAAISQFEPQDQTYVYIDKKAFSAGAFISSATRHIYMAPSGVIGAATPILMSPQGGGAEKMPDSVEQKMTSGIRALARAEAQRNGHNPAVFDAMIDRDLGLVVEGKEILPKGKILTLTNVEAEVLYGKPGKPLLSRGTVENLEAMIQKIGGDSAVVTTLEPTGFEQLARWITMISPFLLTAGLLLGYLEFKTPGFGLFGVGAAVCFFVFFFGHYVAGMSGQEPLLLFVAGVIFIAVELFLFPGLVIPILVGLVLVFGSILVAMTDFYPTQGWLPQIGQLQTPVLNLTLAMGGTVVGAMLLARYFPARLLFGRLDAGTVMGAGIPEGAVSVRVGEVGKAATTLRPSGRATFAGEPVDVITEGMMVEAGTAVRVIEISGTKVVVAADAEGRE
jgi:membrane-bound serine protease (ClpP class)